ncbi:MAG: SRPBCC family protein [Prevotella sp.]|jgi:hypothetical protein|nr:SRPBCC family protein [Prevotella sp.]
MAEFVSEIKIIPYSDTDIFAVLSDLNNLELAKDKIPQNTVKDLTFDQDSCSVNVEPMGKVKFVVVEREPNKAIKFQSEKLPFDVNMWIQLVATADNETKMKLTVRADLNPFLKPMVSKPLQAGLDKVAEGLADLPYSEILKRSKE